METAKIERISLSHRKMYTDIMIDAAPQDVWTVLTDTASYANWAAFMIKVHGDIADGTEIEAVFQMNPKREKFTPIKHRITVTDGSEFHWSDTFPGGIRDNHHFRVEPAEDDKTRFVQTDEFWGGLTWLMGGTLAKTCTAGYQAFNRSLKQEVEQRRASA